MKRWMSRIAAVLLGISVLIATVPVSAANLRYEYPTDEEPIGAPSAVMLHMGVKPEQDVYLYEKNADVRYAPGALMRVAMLGYAMQLIEEKQLDIDTVTGEYTLYLFNHYVAGTGLHVALMNFGETWTLKDLLTICTIQTAADCAVTLATALSGSPEAFVDGMNAYAQQLGCTNSHFTNVSGLNEDGQYMSARDTAIFTRKAMQYRVINEALTATHCDVSPVSGGKSRGWPNSCELIRKNSVAYYQHAYGGKTGGTPTELSLVAFSGNDGDETYMAVVMGAQRNQKNEETPELAYADARRLIRWGLLDFQYEILARKSEPIGRVTVKDSTERHNVSLVLTNDFSTVLNKSVNKDEISRRVVLTTPECIAPIEAGQVLGTVEFYYGEALVGTMPLVAGESAARDGFYAVWNDVLGFLTSGWMILILVIVALLIVGYVVLNITYNRRKRKRAQEKE